ncbi:MAG: hypothetical protein KA714_17515 [Limnoraphis sp. WC205]|nr:hypothetical protein [Limnoraphis sp. WC205]
MGLAVKYSRVGDGKNLRILTLIDRLSPTLHAQTPPDFTEFRRLLLQEEQKFV